MNVVIAVKEIDGHLCKQQRADEEGRRNNME